MEKDKACTVIEVMGGSGVVDCSEISEKTKDRGQKNSGKMRNIHNCGNIQVEKYECRICGRTFTKKLDMLIHRITHSSKSEISCKELEMPNSPDSNRNIPSKDDQVSSSQNSCSVLSEDEAMETSAKQRMTSCGRNNTSQSPSETRDVSSMQLESLEGVKITDLTTGWRVYRCSACRMAFCDITSYKNHILSHPERLHYCPKCGKFFTIKGNLQRHLLSHQDVRPFKCEVCKKSFSQKAHLEAHMNVHDKFRTYYICSVCGHGFTRQGNLKRHERIHTQERPFRCRICGRSFSQPGNLKAHESTHSEVRPFECSECGKTFTRKGNLTRHLELHREQQKLGEVSGS